MGNDPLIDAIADAVERAPDVPVLRAHLAQLLVDKNRYAEAVTHCGVCLTQDPGNPLGLQMLEQCVVALKGHARWLEAKRTDPPQPPTAAKVSAADRQPTVDFREVRHAAAEAPTAPTFERLSADIDELIWSLHPEKPAAANPPPEPEAVARRRQVVAALVDFTESGMDDVPLGSPGFTSSSDADQLVLTNPFAFLVAVQFDQSVPAERAWRAPHELALRLGHLDPRRIVEDRDSVRRAITTPTSLHHFADNMAAWIVAAAIVVVDQYDGDAAAIWRGNPTARDVQERLESFPGIGEAKAAMAVQMLSRDCDVPIRDVPGSAAAYDVHVRRVLLRTGLAEADELDHMREVVRSSDPTSGAGIALPAWQVGRTWCRPRHQQCHSCPLAEVCQSYSGRTWARANLEGWLAQRKPSVPRIVDNDCA